MILIYPNYHRDMSYSQETMVFVAPHFNNVETFLRTNDQEFLSRATNVSPNQFFTSDCCGYT